VVTFYIDTAVCSTNGVYSVCFLNGCRFKSINLSTAQPIGATACT